MSIKGALHGVLVLEVGQRGAVAICGQLLSQLGATVICVEHDGNTAGKSLNRPQYMAGKLSFKPTRERSQDRAVLDKLFASSDIVLISSDVDPPLLRLEQEQAPINVVCDITAFGATGALAGYPLSELEIQAMSGIMDTTGFADRPPVPIRVPIVDVIAGTYAAAAAIAAHRVRRDQGAGQRVDMALFDGAFASLRSFLTTVLTSDKSNKSRMGNRHPTVAPWNLYRSSDGFVLICAGNTFGMYEKLCNLIGHPDMAPRFPTQKARVAAVSEMDPAIESWTQQYTTAECVEKLLAVGVVSGPIVPVEQYPREGNLDFRRMIGRAFDPVAGRDIFVPASPFRMSLTPGLGALRIPSPDADRTEVAEISERIRPSGTPASAPNRRSLEGVRIIEIGQYTTAPMCSRELAHLGAEVIKIEQPSAAESRAGADQIGGVSVSFKMNNADKKTLVVDLRAPQGLEMLRRLLATADVLVENLKPGTLAKFGFTPQAIQGINPRLVYCAITGFGIESLYPVRPAFDMVITAMAGFMSVLSEDGQPLKSGISTADIMGAQFAMVAILAGLEYRDRTGQGQLIDLSMQDVTAWLTQAAWNDQLDGRIAPAVLQAADGYLLVEAGDLVVDAALLRVPEHTLTTLHGLDRASVVQLLTKLGVAAVPVQTVREAANMPHTIGRKLWFRMQEDGVEWPMLGSPLRLTATPPTVTHLALPMDSSRNELLAEIGMMPAPVPAPDF